MCWFGRNKQTKMRILIINDLDTPGGGAEYYIVNLKKMLTEKNHEATILKTPAKHNTSKSNLIKSFKFIAIALRSFFNFEYYKKTIDTIKKFKPDILHINSMSRILGISPILAAKKFNIPIVLTSHGHEYFCPKFLMVYQDSKICKYCYGWRCLIAKCKTNKESYFYYPFYWFQFIKLFFYRFLIKKHVNHFIFPSKLQREYSIKSLKLNQNFCTYLPNFIFIDENKKINNLNKIPKNFLYVGRISKEKGLGVAIKAIDFLVKKRDIKDIKLRIIGEGENYTKKLEEEINRLGLHKNVEFIGRIPNEKLSKYYQESTAIIVPSIWFEIFGLINIEAMANKTPMISSRVGGMVDIIDTGKIGYLFEMGNHKELAFYMEKLYKNPKLSVKLGESGYKKYKRHFRRDLYYNQLIKIYQDLNEDN